MYSVEYSFIVVRAYAQQLMHLCVACMCVHVSAYGSAGTRVFVLFSSGAPQCPAEFDSHKRLGKNKKNIYFPN